MKQPLEKFIAEVDQLIKSAQGDEAKTRLKELPKSSIPAPELWRIAALCRRANLPELSIRILRHIIRPVKKKAHEASNEEITEYAAALMRLGAIEESIQLLKKVDAKKVPESLFFRAIAELKEWDYAEAAVLLREYLSFPLPAYAQLVGKINLALCILYEGLYDEAKTLLDEIVLETKESKELLLLHANAVRLIGNLELNRNHLRSALGYFVQGENLLASVGGLDHFFSRKWMAITEFLINPKHLEGIRAIEREAIQKQNWETLRDLDYHQAEATQDPKLVYKLYFGSPSLAFRKRITDAFPQIPIPNTYRLILGEETKEPVIEINPLELDHYKVPLKVGQSVHRLFLTLLSDSYRPFLVCSLFESIFPGEFYVPGLSEKRVYQAIQLLRAWFVKNGLPLKVESQQNAYRIEATKACAILLGHTSTQSLSEYRLFTVQKKLAREFSASEVAIALGISRRSAIDLVKKGLESGDLNKIGSGPTTRYAFNKSNASRE